MDLPRAENVGVLAVEAHFPAFAVDQAALERHNGVSTGKYTLGLGQLAMAFPGDREDVNALALTAVARLLDKYDVDPRAVGRLEVGTETLADKAKSTKTVLMSLFEPHGNTDVDGATTINACYGATAALLNAVAWVESSAWDGRLAIVVAADIAVYRAGPARPSGGCGAVAMLIGPDAPLALDLATKTTHATNIWDFFKPDPTSEYATVDGARSLAAYLHALDECYVGYCAKNERRQQRVKGDESSWTLADVDYAVFHSPFNKQVQKSFARVRPPSCASPACCSY
jgi:hydroxymethylglutaryl-CoA synthase